jgi:tetratricopeptide (TPR) repeat protein
MSGGRLVAALAAATLFAVGAQAADEGLVLRTSAEQLAVQDRCDEAIAKARHARAAATDDDAKAAAIEGRCALRLGRYDEAIKALEDARRLDPQLPGVSIDLAMAHYHRGDAAAADAELTRAEAESPDDARVLLYRGLLLMEDAKDREAAVVLERAGRQSASVDPLASYYAALAWQRSEEREKARASLERARAAEPGSRWSKQAADALAQFGSGGDAAPRRFWAALSVGVEYDSNVVLRGDGVSLPRNISDESDGRVWWNVEVGAEAFRTENWAGGAVAGYYGSAHFELHDFDIAYPNGSVWLDRRIDDESFLRLQPFIGYAATDYEDSYLFHGGATLSYHRRFEEAGSGRLWAQYGYNDYRFDIPPLVVMGTDLSRRLDRDGSEYRAGYDHAYGLTDTTTLKGGVSYLYYEADGRDYDFSAYGGYAGFEQRLPARFVLDATVSFSYEPYRSKSVFDAAPPVSPPTGPKRLDKVTKAGGALSRPITDWLEAAVYYSFTDNDSNIGVYDYDRHIAGGFITLSYGP